MLIDVCIKFREYSLSGFQVIERTRFVTDRQTRDGQTDGQTDGGPGKNNMSPDPKGGRHNDKTYNKLTSSFISLPTEDTSYSSSQLLTKVYKHYLQVNGSEKTCLGMLSLDNSP